MEKEANEIGEKIKVVELELSQVKEENNQKRLEKIAVIKEVKESLDQMNNINMEIKRYIYNIYIILELLYIHIFNKQ